MRKKILNPLFSASLIAATLVSCSKSKSEEQQELVQKNVEEMVKPKLNDPSSYEFADLKLTDSVNNKHNIDAQREQFRLMLEMEEDNLKQEGKYKAEGYHMYNQTREQESAASVAKYKRLMTELDAIEAKLDDKKLKETASYTYKYSFRGKNALGAVVVNEYLLQTTPGPDYKVINIAEESAKLFPVPNGFPGLENLK